MDLAMEHRELPRTYICSRFEATLPTTTIDGGRRHKGVGDPDRGDNLIELGHCS